MSQIPPEDRLTACEELWPPALDGPPWVKGIRLITHCMWRWLCSLGGVRLYVPLWTTACQAPLSVALSTQEHWGRLPSPPLRDLPNPEIKPRLLCLPRCRQILSGWAIRAAALDTSCASLFLVFITAFTMSSLHEIVSHFNIYLRTSSVWPKKAGNTEETVRTTCPVLLRGLVRRTSWRGEKVHGTLKRNLATTHLLQHQQQCYVIKRLPWRSPWLSILSVSKANTVFPPLRSVSNFLDHPCPRLLRIVSSLFKKHMFLFYHSLLLYMVFSMLE